MSNHIATQHVNAVTIAVLLNIIRLLGIELVAGEHRDNPERLASAILARIRDTPLNKETTSAEAIVGYSIAEELLRPVLKSILARAETVSLFDKDSPSKSLN